MHYADSDGVGLAYRVLGNGPIDTVVVTNWATNVEGLLQLDGWMDLVARLSRTMRFVVFDQRGSGMSDRVALADVDGQVRDLAAVLDAAGLERAVLLAADMSCTPALAFAARHPDRTRAVILMNPVVRLAGVDHDDADVETAVLDNLVELVTSGWGRDDSAFALLGTPGPDRARDRAHAARSQRQALSPRDLAPLARTWLSLDARPFCSQVQAPVLVMVRTGDQLVAPEQGRWAAAHLPDATLVELPGDDHFVFFGDRRAVVAAIEEFLHGQAVPVPTEGRLVAAVLVDIVGSTARAAREGPAGWDALRSRHDGAVREEVELRDGRVVNTAGDSHLVLFDSAVAAVRFAVAAERRSHDLDLPVRVGVHVGEVAEADGAAAGLALHVVARVQRAADPGEVLVTRAVHDVLLGSDMVLVPRGRRALRGLAGRWALYAVETS